MRNVLTNIVVLLVTVVLGTAVAEAMVRWLDANVRSEALDHLDAIPLAPGVQRAWFAENPPPLPNRRSAAPEAVALLRRVEASAVSDGTWRTDIFKAWNSAFVGRDPCAHPYLGQAPGPLRIYDPPDGAPRPPYRFLPDTTTPVGLVTNAHGFRGPPVPAARRPGTIRIAFIGASTTVGAHAYLHSYPEHVGHWLDRWAAARAPGVAFEVLNAGRESIKSPDIAAIVRSEVAPLAPDLVVYYEGANQFDLRPLVPGMGKRPDDAPMVTPRTPGLLERVMIDLGYSFALARRAQSLLAAHAPYDDGGSKSPGGEWSKPAYTLAWPKGLDERDPDIARADLPVHLSTILADLDRIRAATASAGGELALASYKWLVADGMVLDPKRHRAILEYLNVGYAPFSYRDLERLALFQNRVLEKYAAARGIDFLDVARLMPSDPDLFVDAIHGTPEGVRLRAWIMLQLLVPVIERHLADGTWPKKDFAPPPPLAPYTPRTVDLECKKQGDRRNATPK